MNRTINGTSLAAVQEKARSVNNNLARNGKSRIAREILAYLVDHPDAQDTLEGIVRWWLPEQEIKCQIGKVKEVVSKLVKKELLLAHKSTDSRVHYRINRKKFGEIRALLEKKSFRQGAQR
jgi:hypothetical protein